MTVNINQIIINTLNEDRSVKNSKRSESYVLTPDSGKVLRDKKTGRIFTNTVSISTKSKISDYEEIYLNKK